MKRFFSFVGFAILLTGMVFSAGCHTQSLSSFKPSKTKFAVGIVGSKELTGTEEIQNFTNKITHESGTVFSVQRVENQTKAQEALTALSTDKNIDLILTEGKYSSLVDELTKTYSDKKYGIVNSTLPIDSKHIRQITVNREFQSFVAGYIASSLSPKESVAVVVSSPRSSQSPEWKGLLEGIHYAGSLAAPVAITREEAMGQDGSRRIKFMASRIVIVLDPITEQQLAFLNQNGKLLLLMYDEPKLYSNVLGKPRSIFTEGIQNHVQALIHNSWQDGVSTLETGTTFFDFIQPEKLPAGTQEAIKRIEEGLHSQTILPEQYFLPPKSR